MAGRVQEEGVDAPTGTVTFLLTDVEASTELWQHAPEAAELAIARHDALIAEHVAAHGAYRPRDQGEGDSALLAFARARDALACALALQHALASEPWPAGAALRVRMALHTGEAELSDGNYKGSAVHRCARVRALARGGQVLLSDTTVQLVRDRLPVDVELRDLGTHQLRGLDHAEHVFQLCHPGLPSDFGSLASAVTGAESAADGRLVPLPASLVAPVERSDRGAFVGRGGVFENLEDRLTKLQAGRAEVVLVSGEAGIGKTRLCTEVGRGAHDGGAIVLYGRCDEDLGVSYHPWVEALTHLVRHAPQHVEARTATDLEHLVPAVREVMPSLPPAAHSSDPETDRYLLFGAVAALLAAASVDQPVVLVLDDLHWADKPTVMLLRSLLKTPIELRVLILGTYRESDIGRGHPLSEALPHLWREPTVERVALGGLDDLGLVALLEATVGHALDDEGVALAHALRRETDGNPFFTTEILRHLEETGAIQRDTNGHWAATLNLDAVTLPASVRDVVGERVARLGDDASQVLSTAAVIGREFELGLLGRVVGREPDDLLDLLDAAVEAAVIEEVPNRAERFTFSHGLIQRTLYEHLGATRRGRLHRRVAEALDELATTQPIPVGDLAHHWAAATAPVQAQKAAEYAMRAGEQALAALAPDEATRWFTQALELVNPGDGVVRCELLIALGEAQRQAGIATHRETLLEAAALADRLGDAGLLVAAALTNNRGFESAVGEVDRERIAVLERALDASGDAASTGRARLLATLSAELSFAGEPDRLRGLMDEALRIARSAGDPATLVWVLNMHDSALRLPETLADRHETTAEAVRVAETLGDPVAIFRSARHVLDTALETGNRALRDQAIEIQHEIATRVGQPLLIWIDTQNRSQQALLDGDPDEAERLAEEALTIGTESGQPDALTAYGGQLLVIRLHQGRTDEILELVAEFVAETGIPAFAAGLASFYVDAGHESEAEVLLHAVASNAFAGYPRDELWLLGMARWAHVAARLGTTDTAAAIYEQLVPWCGQIPSMVVGVIEPVDNYLGRLASALGRFDTAEAHFAASEAQSRAFGCPYFVASTQYQRALARITAGTPDGAASLLDEVESLARTHGYRWLEQHAGEARNQLS